MENALIHYSEAHKYYSKCDISPTLVLILTDMCDLYLASYAASEPQLSSLVQAKKLIAPVEPALTGVQSAEWTPTEASSLVTQLLGGALQCLIDCRYAFTAAVVERYPVRLGQLSVEVAVKLTKILLKVLQAQGRGQLQPRRWLVGDNLIECEVDYLAIKETYSRLAKVMMPRSSSSPNVSSKFGAEAYGELCQSVYSSLCLLSTNKYVEHALLSSK